MERKLILLVVALAAFGLLLAACGPAPTPCPTPVPCPDCPEAPDCPACPDCPECPEPDVSGVPYQELWVASGHADATAEAFRHWDEDDPKEVPTNCAKCHSSYGYQDFLGVDGTAAGTVDNAAAVDSVIDCVACHNEGTAAMDSVLMPSGIEVTGLGDEARCMQCHQGRESSVSVNDSITAANVADDDTVSADLGFRNIHYYAAAATKYGTLAKGGYEYAGKTYDGNFAHVDGYDTCIGCHDSHSLEIKVDECAVCHTGVSTVEDLRAVRMAGSLVDYDGDGDVSEGIASEIAGLQEMLYAAIQAYGEEVAGMPVVYDAAVYPYFLNDAGERFSAWTARLLKAAYNYQVSFKDPGGYAHGGKYLIALLYDSIEDLNTALSSPIDLSAAHRIDAGHFAGSEEAFRHWDAEGEVPGSCAKCHTGVGMPIYLANGTNIAEHPANGLLCVTCHDEANWPARYEVGAVTFPSGARIDSGTPDLNLCMNCHQGRESTVSVNRLIAGQDDDTVSESLRFLNVHYFAAGATLFGGEAQGAYQYTGKEYVGRFAHVPGFDTCVSCHETHGLTVNEEACATCHAGIESPQDARISTTDYDGDGDTTEGLAGEIVTMYEKLYAAMQEYATTIAGAGIEYNPMSYPYWFTTEGERFATWTPRLLRAAYNYQYVAKDPGAFAHNGKYILQVLYDALEDMGQAVDVDMTGMVRP